MFVRNALAHTRYLYYNYVCVILYPAFFMPIVLDLSAPPDDGTATAADASSPRYRLSREDPDSGGGGDKSGGGGVMPSIRGGGDVAAVGDVPVARSGGNGVEISGGGEVDTSGGG